MLSCSYTDRIAKPQTTHDPDSLETALPTANATVAVAFVFLQAHTGCAKGESEVDEERTCSIWRNAFDTLLSLHFMDVISTAAINQSRLR